MMKGSDKLKLNAKIQKVNPGNKKGSCETCKNMMECITNGNYVPSFTDPVNLTINCPGYEEEQK